MRKNFTIFMITLLVSLLSGTASAQRLAVKSNLLYDITSTINLGVEYEVAPRWTLEMSANYNPWSFSDNKKMKLWMLQPEARYWLCSGFSGHFFGAHLLGGEFNYGGMLPFGITPSSSGLGSKRYQGWMAGAGIGYGYNWVLGKRWNLEATLGVGYIHFGYDRFDLSAHLLAGGGAHLGFYLVIDRFAHLARQSAVGFLVYLVVHLVQQLGL